MAPSSARRDSWLSHHGWPVLSDVAPAAAFPQFRMPFVSWDRVHVWNAGVGGSQYLLLIAHRRSLTKEMLASLIEACNLADMWFVVEPSFEIDGGVMAVITSFWNEFYS